MGKFIIHITSALAAFILLAGCAPQLRLFTVDVKNAEGYELKTETGSVAVFPVTPSAEQDSVRLSNVALGIAEKFEQDRVLPRGSISVFAIPQQEFAGFDKDKPGYMQEYDRQYLQDLMLKSGEEVQIFVNNLVFYPYTVNRVPMGTDYEYGTNIVLPYSMEMNIYNVMQDSLVYSQARKDTIYLQVLTGDKNLNNLLLANLPDIAKKIGIGLASKLSTQWITQERMLIVYEDATDWEKAYYLAQDFKWDEAIAAWMPFTTSQNPKKAAYAAYNIAVACEMMEQLPLALEWVNYSLEKSKFREADQLKNHLLTMMKKGH